MRGQGRRDRCGCGCGCGCGCACGCACGCGCRRRRRHEYGCRCRSRCGRARERGQGCQRLQQYDTCAPAPQACRPERSEGPAFGARCRDQRQEKQVPRCARDDKMMVYRESPGARKKKSQPARVGFSMNGAPGRVRPRRLRSAASRGDERPPCCGGPGIPGRTKEKSQPARVGFSINGAPGRIRTSDPQVRSLVLYPTELRARGRSGILK